MTKKRKSNFGAKVSKNVEKQRNESKSYGYLNLPKGITVFKEEAGKKRVKMDVIPYEVTDKMHPDRDVKSDIAVPGELWYKRPFKIHRDVGPDNDAVVCLASIGKKCPICEYRAKQMKEGADKEETDALRPKKRCLYAIIPIDNKEFKEELHVWDISEYLFQNLLNDELEEDDAFCVFPDLEDGLTLSIRFDEQRLGKNKFAEASRIDFKEREEAYTEDMLDEVPNLDKVLKVLAYDELEKLFLEIDAEDTEDYEEEEQEEQEEKPRRKKKTARKKPAPKEEEEEEEEEEQEEEEDEEEEEKPKRRRKSKTTKKPKKESVKEEEQEEEEEEEEEKPKKKSSKKSAKGKCPHGHVFGEDADKHPEDCDECEEWDDCIDAS